MNVIVKSSFCYPKVGFSILSANDSNHEMRSQAHECVQDCSLVLIETLINPVQQKSGRNLRIVKPMSDVQNMIERRDIPSPTIMAKLESFIPFDKPQQLPNLKSGKR